MGMNQETRNLSTVFLLRGGHLRRRERRSVSCAPFLLGSTLAIVLGLVSTLSTPALAQSPDRLAVVAVDNVSAGDEGWIIAIDDIAADAGGWIAAIDNVAAGIGGGIPAYAIEAGSGFVAFGNISDEVGNGIAEFGETEEEIVIDTNIGRSITGAGDESRSISEVIAAKSASFENKRDKDGVGINLVSGSFHSVRVVQIDEIGEGVDIQVYPEARLSGDIRVSGGTSHRLTLHPGFRLDGKSVVSSGDVKRILRLVSFPDLDVNELRSFHGFDNLEINGANRLSGDVEGFKEIAFTSRNNDDTLTVSGNYGGLGDLVFDVGAAGWKDDKLTVEGNVTLESKWDVSIRIPEKGRRKDKTISAIGEMTESPVLVEVRGDARPDNFSGEETIGAFDYVLKHERDVVDGVDRWRFRQNGLSSSAATVSGLTSVLSDLTSVESDRDDGREDGLWANERSLRTIVGSRSRMEDDRVHFGFDIPAADFMGGDVVMGASIWQGLSSSDVLFPIRKGVIDVESHAAALAALWRSSSGLYVDGRARHVRFSSDIRADRHSLVRDNGGAGMSASAETGYRFAVPLGGMDLHVAPQVELVWSRVGFDDFVGPRGELVSLEDGVLVRGRLGLSWDGEWRGAGGLGRVYGGMNLRDALDGRTSVSVSGFSVVSEQGGLSVDGRLGVSYEWNEIYAVRGEAMAMRRDGADEVRANLGVYIEF